MTRLLLTNIKAAAETVWLVSITAPGSDVLPCSDTTCAHKGPHLQRSKDGCRVDELHAIRWNRSAPGKWSQLHHACVERIRAQGHSSPLVAYVWQMQARGVLHLHLVLDLDPAMRAATYAYVAALRELSHSYGFGNIDARDRDGKAGKSGVMESGRAASYLSRYLAQSEQFTQALRLPKDARPRRMIYVTRRATSLTACTMRNLRRVRYLWAIRTLPGSALSRAGRLPRWFRDPLELAQVQSLARFDFAPS